MSSYISLDECDYLVNPSEKQILEVLINIYPGVASFSMLASELYPGNVIRPHNVYEGIKVRISNIRRKIGQNAIINERRKGWRINYSGLKHRQEIDANERTSSQR